MATEKKTIVVELQLQDKGAVELLGRLEIETKKYQRELRVLNAEITKNGTATKEQEREVGRLNATIRRNQTQLRELKNDLSGATAAGLRFRDKMAEASRAGLGAFGLQLGGVAAATAGFVTIIKDAVQTISSFQQANANLASILGVSREDIEALTASAIELGPALGRLPEEVTALQTELAKLGFTEEQILAAQEAVILLANATGEDLGKSAAVAAATLKGFDLVASDTQRIVDVMAQSFNSTSLDLEKFSVAMATLAPAAKAAGFTLEETTSLIGILADRGLDASVVGTSLRSIFIDLAKTGGNLDDALAQINASTNKTKTAFELFGERAAGAAVILAENIDQSDRLAVAFDNAGGAAQEMATVQLATLEGATKQVNASWDAFILSLDSGEGFISTTLRATLQGLAGDFSALGEAQNAFEFFGALMDRTTSLSLQARAELEKQTAAQKDLNAAATSFLDIETAQQKSLEELTARLAVVTKHQADYASENKNTVAAEFAFEAAIIRSAIALKDEGQALVDNANTFTTVAAKRAALTLKLEEAKTARDDLNASDTAGLNTANANIASIQQQIKALEGLTEAEKKLAQARADAAAARSEETPTLLSPVSTDAGGEQTPLGFTPEALTAAEQASQRFLLLQEQVRADEIQGITDFNLQRQLLDAEYLDQKIIGLSEYNARAKVIEDGARQQQIESQNAVIQGVGEFFGALAQLTEQGSAEFKAFATTQALINTYLGVSQVLATPSTLLEPFATISKILNVAVILATGLASVKKIQGFAKSGRVRSEGGTVRHGDGPSIRRDNGDDVLITAKRGEVILNDKHQDNLRKLFGSDVFRRIGVPGFAGSGVVGGDTVLVGTRYSVPRPSPSDILAVERGAETRAINFNPVVSVVEINKVQARTKVIEQLSTA